MCFIESREIRRSVKSISGTRAVHAWLAIMATFCVVASSNRAEEIGYQRVDLVVASTTEDSRSKTWTPGDDTVLEVSGLEWMDDNRLAVATRKGDVWFLDGVLGDDADAITFTLFASGLHEPLGLLRDGKDLLVAQRGEVTRLRDTSGDGVADEYITECDAWGITGNYHEYAYGPAQDGQGQRWITLNLGLGPLSTNGKGWRGWGGTIGKDGRFQPQACGMRSPSGLSPNREGDMFYTEQQGNWVPATPIYHLRPGVFYGNQESIPSLDLPGAPFKLDPVPSPNQPYTKALAQNPRFVPPAVWLPYNKMGRSATDLKVVPQDGTFGPFQGQFIVGEFTNSALSRVFLEKVGGEYQGACFPFMSGFPSAVVRLCFAPDGSLFVGMTNRGWSSLGNRAYGLSRVRFDGDAPFAIREMRAKKDGFDLIFTEPVDAASLKNAFAMSSFTFNYSSAYGSDEIDTRQHRITEVKRSDDGLTVHLQVEGLRPLYVHELRTEGVKSMSGRSLDHPDAWYTLNRLP